MITARRWPVVGIVSAGWPSPAEEELLDTISFDEWLIEPSTFMVKVQNNAMQDDVPIGLSGGGYSSRTYTVFMGTEKAVRADDRIITTDGKELRVIGVKQVNSGNEDYLQLSCEESQG